MHSFFLLLYEEEYDLEKILAETVRLLPPFFQQSRLGRVNINFEERQYKTKGYQTTPWKVSSTLKARGKQVGTIEMSYLEPPTYDQELLLKEKNNAGYSSSAPWPCN